MSLNALFGIGTNALAAFQQALSVTGQNISNVNTDGYSRQQAILNETQPQNSRPGQIGTGVEAAQIRRSVDTFIEQQLQTSHARLGQYNANQSVLTQIEPLFADSNDLGIGAAMNDFFKAWQDVATSPGDLTARTVLLSKAAVLTGRFNQSASQLADQRVGLDGQIRQSITDINGLADQVADLNVRITLAEASGQQANDLRDQRGRLLNQLADLIDISSLEDSSGQVSVFVGNGQALVAGNKTYDLSGVANSSNNGLVDVMYDAGGGADTPLQSVITGGRLKGLLDARDTTIPSLQTSLNTLAAQLVSQVNIQHQAGYGLDGSTGQNFFSASGTTASTIAVGLTDRVKIAASSTAAGVPGNNVNALAVASLQTASVAGLGNATYQEYYSATAGSFGAQLQAAERDASAQEIVQEQLEAHRAEVSGVSLDEELVNLLKYQRAYQAASKLITTSDEMLQTILSIKR
jgi:flagellar hook-associated protein 1 FlgK